MLKYRGAMYHGSYVHLRTLSSVMEYSRAIDQLFVASSLPPGKHSNRAMLFLCLTIGVLLAAFALVAGLYQLMTSLTS